jgi:hypothetical protein
MPPSTVFIGKPKKTPLSLDLKILRKIKNCKDSKEYFQEAITFLTEDKINTKIDDPNQIQRLAGWSYSTEIRATKEPDADDDPELLFVSIDHHEALTVKDIADSWRNYISFLCRGALESVSFVYALIDALKVYQHLFFELEWMQSEGLIHVRHDVRLTAALSSSSV